MNTPKRIIELTIGPYVHDEGIAQKVIDSLDAGGYQIMQAVKWPHTIEHDAGEVVK